MADEPAKVDLEDKTIINQAVFQSFGKQDTANTKIINSSPQLDGIPEVFQQNSMLIPGFGRIPYNRPESVPGDGDREKPAQNQSEIPSAIPASALPSIEEETGAHINELLRATTISPPSNSEKPAEPDVAALDASEMPLPAPVVIPSTLIPDVTPPENRTPGNETGRDTDREIAVLLLDPYHTEDLGLPPMVDTAPKTPPTTAKVPPSSDPKAPALEKQFVQIMDGQAFLEGTLTEKSKPIPGKPSSIGTLAAAAIATMPPITKTPPLTTRDIYLQVDEKKRQRKTLKPASVADGTTSISFNEKNEIKNEAHFIATGRSVKDMIIYRSEEDVVMSSKRLGNNFRITLQKMDGTITFSDGTTNKLKKDKDGRERPIPEGKFAVMLEQNENITYVEDKHKKTVTVTITGADGSTKTGTIGGATLADVAMGQKDANGHYDGLVTLKDFEAKKMELTMNVVKNLGTVPKLKVGYSDLLPLPPTPKARNLQNDRS